MYCEMCAALYVLQNMYSAIWVAKYVLHRVCGEIREAEACIGMPVRGVLVLAFFVGETGSCGRGSCKNGGWTGEISV